MPVKLHQIYFPDEKDFARSVRCEIEIETMTGIKVRDFGAEISSFERGRPKPVRTKGIKKKSGIILIKHEMSRELDRSE